MKLNHKNPMQTEGKETTKPCEITFLKKSKVFILAAHLSHISYT